MQDPTEDPEVKCTIPTKGSVHNWWRISEPKVSVTECKTGILNFCLFFHQENIFKTTERNCLDPVNGQEVSTGQQRGIALT